MERMFDKAYGFVEKAVYVAAVACGALTVARIAITLVY